jgi:GTPase Era involved in 16S rRNA processing
MTRLVSQLQTRLEQILHLLENGAPPALSLQDTTAIRDQAIGLSEKLARAESEPLAIGLLGGTGVGKSTVMNALAGSEISTAGHRRPWTDHILVYRHEEARGLPPDQLNGIPWKEFTHQDASIGKILICDMPDFDSIQTHHRELVLAFVKHLDLLVWVTSPEKYADQQFHDFLTAVPKARQNFFFVLNKLDLMFDAQDSGKGYQDIEVISQAFHKRLRAGGISEPLVFLVSAKDTSETLWNQFPMFKKQVFQERRLKEVMAIKAANLDVEVQSLIRHVSHGITRLEIFETLVAEALEELGSQRTIWFEEWDRAVVAWTESRVRKKIQGQRPAPVPLLGPGYGLALAMDRLGSTSQKKEGGLADLASLSFPDAVHSTFETHLHWLQARMERQILRQNLPEIFSDRIKNNLQIPTRLESLKSALTQTVALHLASAPWPSFSPFKIWQGICYFLVLAVFLVAIGGETSWKDVLNNPGINSLSHLILSGIHTLFGSKGLAALGSYVIINIFLGFRFYRRFLRLTDRLTDKRVEALRAGLTSTWENQVDAVAASLNEMREDIQRQKSNLSAITGPVS